LLDVEEHIVEDVQNVVFILGEDLLAHPNQEGAEENALISLSVTFMYSPKQRLLLDRR
jgi:hypothetical protein